MTRLDEIRERYTYNPASGRTQEDYLRDEHFLADLGRHAHYDIPYLLKRVEDLEAALGMLRRNFVNIQGSTHQQSGSPNITAYLQADEGLYIIKEALKGGSND